MSQGFPPGQGPVDPRGVLWVPPQGPASMPPGTPPPTPPAGPAWVFQPPRRGRFRRWVGGILIVLISLVLATSLVMNSLIVWLVASTTLNETPLLTGGTDKVAVVSVEGVIEDSTYQQIDATLRELDKAADIKALVVQIDTPGGDASASEEIYHRLMLFKETHKIPIVIAQRGMATSGGYMVSCAGDFIIAEHGTLTGNIGVLMPRVNFSKLLDKWGIQETTLTATGSPGHSYKNAGSMLQPPDPQDEAYLQSLMNGIFANFQQIVTNGRQGKLVDASNDIFSGKAFTADQALARGLIDQEGYPQNAWAKAASLAGISNPTVTLFTRRAPGVLSLLLSKSTVPAPQAQNVNVDGVTLSAQDMERLLTTRPLLIWRGN